MSTLSPPSDSLSSPPSPSTDSPSSSPDSFTVPPNAILTFTDLQAFTGHKGSPPLLQSVSGYVRRGGLTAVLGGGASGKSLLLRLLCGREPLLVTSGAIRCGGRAIRLGSTDSPLGFVGQEDTSLLGELTPRDVVGLNARLGSACRRSEGEVDALIEATIKGLGLTEVANNVIGTVLRRGLSGGEKRRVSVGAVLASRPDVLCLDEATSGLDAAVAYTVIQAIKALAQTDGIGVMLTIHQPSARILTLCDDLILLNAGRVVYMGPTDLALSYFDSLGFPCPPMTTPTDHFLDVVRNAHGAPAFFIDGYDRSHLKKSLHSQLQVQQSTARGTTGGEGGERQMAPFHTQVGMLLHRNFQIAMKDISLYYLQMMLAAGVRLHDGGRVLAAAPHRRLPYERHQQWDCVDLVHHVLPADLQGRSIHPHHMVCSAAPLRDVPFSPCPGSDCRVCDVRLLCQIYHLFTWKERVKDENANGLYSYTAWTVANFITSCIANFCVYVPTLLIAFGMMGLPNAAAGTVIAFIFMIAMTSEAMVELFCHFTRHLPTAILLGQGSMVILCVYAGGAFIRWSELGFWVWLSELSLYTFSTRGMLIAVYKHLEYSCPADLMNGNGCSYQGVQYTCDGPIAADGGCQVSGMTVLQQYQRVDQTDEWTQFGYLVAPLLRLPPPRPPLLPLPPP